MRRIVASEAARSLRTVHGLPVGWTEKALAVGHDDAVARRSYGTGSLIVRKDSTGRESWHAKVRVGQRQVWRKLGQKRTAGTRVGLTRRQAEARLRALQEELSAAPPIAERLSVTEVGRRYLRHLSAIGRKRSTLMDYESTLRVHLEPFFGELALAKADRHEIEAFIAQKAEEGRAPKSIRNYLGLLHSIFAYAEKQGWARTNPCKLVEGPRAASGDADVRFLDQSELEALLRAVPEAGVGSTDRILYLSAAMTGLRQGELVALRWRDVDWPAARVRVRRSYVRGEFGTPKSKRSSRSVPLADRLASELERHFQRSAFQADDDLVFCHPHRGIPLERSRLLKRFKANLARACVREVRFHDLRHTFGTRMAGAGVPLRTLQEWMGHRDFKTTLIYADYQPSEREAELVERAFNLSLHTTADA